MSVADLYRNRGVNLSAVQQGLYRLQPDANTVGLWWFDEKVKSVLHDMSTTPHDFSINGASWNGLGPWGSGLTFDATNDYIELGINQLVAQFSNGTIEMVIGGFNPTAPGVANSLWTEGATGSFVGAWSFYRGADNTLIFGCWIGSWSVCTSAVITWSRTISHYIALTWGNSSSQWYVDGVASGSAGGTGKATIAMNNPVRVGYRSDGTYPMDGNIYTIRCSNVTRSAAEILANAKLMGFA